MTPEERIDYALDRILRSAGSSLEECVNNPRLPAMREATRRVMRESYTEGSNDSLRAKQAMRGGATHP